MNVKLIVTLILGLVFQLAQVLPGAVVTPPCRTVSEACECCEGAQSCDCAENGNSQQKPSPAPQEPGSVLKVPAAKPAGDHLSAGVLPEVEPAVSVAAAILTKRAPGYAGVRLSVTFCRFVI